MTAYKNDYGQIFDSQKSHRKNNVLDDFAIINAK